MKVWIEIDCDGAAFDEDAGGEVERILREAARAFRNSGCTAPDAVRSWLTRDPMKLRDVNGNTVGKVTVDADAPQEVRP